MTSTPTAQEVRALADDLDKQAATTIEARAANHLRSYALLLEQHGDARNELEKRLWSIIDRDGLAEVPSDIMEAVSRLVRRIKDAREKALEEAAQYHERKAEIHAKDALWMGPQRQRYEGARVPDIEMAPMNGPAIAYDREMQDVAAIRALKQRPAPPASSVPGRERKEKDDE